ncbi:MAG: hypothetical protein M3R51_08900 [Candidatus Eremiobacteraeota bacterium]|nr:hypothetical protein [Candidatus Eremiobacteraeota bacterium]
MNADDTRAWAMPEVPQFDREDYQHEPLAAIVAELALCRVRERALTETLESGPFDRQAYSSAIDRVLKRDYAAIINLILLKPQAFSAHYAQWLADQPK